ncbi:MerR family transcriptional regulator [Devosia albogilva]|uniref:MerR family transcriptional regulator n=1 Tax=Devosia albogilva TaxID=429726 RepID=A0ABW5QFA7_9HYPH
MKTYTVSQLAQLAGVSVRTLHHYDEIGLLKPAYTGENRYRHYGEEELMRLQQILIHRELDIPLDEIRAILDAPGFDRIETLARQRARLEEQSRRYAQMVKTIDRTIAKLKGGCAMTAADLYSGVVSPEKQAEYDAWLVEKYGPEMEDQLAVSREAMSDQSASGMAARMTELKEIEEALAEGLRHGVPPQAAALEPAIAHHRDWIAASWGRDCTPQAYAGLADIYEHPDFKARFEAIEPGFADYLTTAMRSWASRQAG